MGTPVEAAVAKEAGTPAVQITLMNGRYLSVGIVNSPLGKLPREDKDPGQLTEEPAAEPKAASPAGE